MDKNKWISVKDGLPDEYEVVAVLTTSKERLTAWASNWHGASSEFSKWITPHDDEDLIVTHWAKLPELPED